MVRNIIKEHKEIMDQYGYPQKLVELQDKFKKGELSPESNYIKGELKAPNPEDIPKVPEEGTSEYEDMKKLGEEAIKNNQVGVVVLNGGMATRFGGGVKGLVEVYDGKSFLQLKIENAISIAKRYNAIVPVFIMNSFQSERLTEEYLKEKNNFGYDYIYCFNQLISIRLEESGEVFTDEKGKPSFYAPGHGDFHQAFVNSGMLDKFLEQGGKYLFFSNGDNLPATLDPVIIGLHIKNGNDMTTEVAEKDTGDKGGAPAFVDGKLQIVENFKFPPDFDQDTIPVMNTNSFVFSAEALKKEIELDFYVALKKVDGKTVVQFERLVNEMSIHLKAGFVTVPKEGLKTRFQPIKLREYLEKHRGFLKQIMEKRNNE